MFGCETAALRLTRRGVRARTCVFVLAGLGVVPSARAEPAQRDFAYEYRAPAECPEASAFEQAVLSRLPAARVVPRDDATLVFDVELASGHDDFSGVLVIGLRDGTRVRRDVLGGSCAEALSALAVIAALSLDGYRREPTPPEAPNVEPPSNPAPAPPARAPRAVPRDREPPPVAARRRASVTPGLFVAASWESAVAPTAPLGVLGGFDVELSPRGVLQPSLRLGLLGTAAATETAGTASADFQLVTGRLTACVLGVGHVSLSARGCVDLDAGTLRARGSVEGGATQTMPWLAAGPSARGAFALTRWLALEATAGLRLLARSDRFVFRHPAPDGMSLPSTVVHDVSAISFGLGLGLAAQLR